MNLSTQATRKTLDERIKPDGPCRPLHWVTHTWGQRACSPDYTTCPSPLTSLVKSLHISICLIDCDNNKTVLRREHFRFIIHYVRHGSKPNKHIPHSNCSWGFTVREKGNIWLTKIRNRKNISSFFCAIGKTKRMNLYYTHFIVSYEDL